MSYIDQAARELGTQWDQNKVILNDQYDALESQIGGVDLIDRASLDTLKGFNQADHAQSLSRSRMGLGVTADQQRAMDRTRSLGQVKAVSNANNQARLGQIDRDMGIYETMLNSLNGLQATGTEGLTQAAGLENQRNMANDQLAAQKKQDRYARIGGAISTGLGIWGAGLGAGTALGVGGTAALGSLAALAL